LILSSYAPAAKQLFKTTTENVVLDGSRRGSTGN
jgi:hypothetical protein